MTYPAATGAPRSKLGPKTSLGEVCNPGFNPGFSGLSFGPRTSLGGVCNPGFNPGFSEMIAGIPAP